MFNDETVNIVKRENECETFLNLQIFFQSMLDKVNLYNYLQTVSYSDRRKYWNNYNVSNRAILLHNSNFSFDIKRLWSLIMSTICLFLIIEMIITIQ